MHRDAEVVAGFLRMEEAEMLTELLSSSGVEAWFEGAVGATLGALIPGAGGGARLLVPAADAARARELIAASGVFRAESTAELELRALEPSAGPAPDAGRAPRRGGLAAPLYPLIVVAWVVAATAALLFARL